MKIKLSVLGAMGRMGREIVLSALGKYVNDIELVGCLVRDLKEFSDNSLSKVFNNNGISALFVDSIDDAFDVADVIIDFTNPSLTLKCLEINKKYKKCFVSGTTGFNEKQLNVMRESAKHFPFLWSPNMSYGVNILHKILGDLANKLSDYDVSILDVHHRNKKDSPSGTALFLADAIATASNADLSNVMRKNADFRDDKYNIDMVSLRHGSVYGEHTVTFAGLEDEIKISHTAFNRSIFANGSIKAALWLCQNNKKSKLYNMLDVVK